MDKLNIRELVLELEALHGQSLRCGEYIKYLIDLLYNTNFEKPKREDLLRITLEETKTMLEVITDYVNEANNKNKKIDSVISGLIKKTEEGGKEDVL